MVITKKSRAGELKLSRDVSARINEYRDYFESEMSQISRHLREYRENKEEFYRRWSAYSDWNKVQKLLE